VVTTSKATETARVILRSTDVLRTGGPPHLELRRSKPCLIDYGRLNTDVCGHVRSGAMFLRDVRFDAVEALSSL
jgi:hypothetical protein